MNNDLQPESRKTFAPGESERVARRVVQFITESWPEAGSPGMSRSNGMPVFTFNQQEGVEVRVSSSEHAEGLAYMEVEVAATRPHLALPALNRLVHRLGGGWQWFPGSRGDESSFCLSTEFNAARVSFLGEEVLREHITELRHWCNTLCPVRPARMDDAALRQAYKSFDGVLKPVSPWLSQEVSIPDELSGWAVRVYELLAAGTPVGITGETPVGRRLALAVLAEHCLAEDTSLGQLTSTGILPEKLVQLAQQAPGFVAAPARTLTMNSNAYELPDAVNRMMSAFEEYHLPCVFEGNSRELDSLFHGGQGAENDPLKPSSQEIPDVPLETLVHFALWDASQRLNLPLPINMETTARDILTPLQACPTSAERLLTRVAIKVLKEGISGEAVATFIERLAGYTKTFGAIGVRPRRNRSTETQQAFQKGFISSEFMAYLKERLFGQDEALAAFVERMQEETLTRPLHQPLAIALQGTPGTGKSECLALTAQYLNLPHVIIDVASIPDTYTGMAQLLGSGRGIVGSYQAGRLEQVARHYRGAVVEIADIDHAIPSVRSSLGDLFLQIMQTGEAQASIGSMFSCAGLLLGFTLNLPGGKDEKAYQRVGFGGTPTMQDIRRDVQKEIKAMVSGAFLSRLGEPVLFAPLSEGARIAIVLLALKDAAQTLLQRLGCTETAVEVEEEAARELVRSFDSSVMTFGARGLVDMARRHVVKTLLPWCSEHRMSMPSEIRLEVDETGTLAVNHATSSPAYRPMADI